MVRLRLTDRAAWPSYHSPSVARWFVGEVREVSELVAAYLLGFGDAFELVENDPIAAPELVTRTGSMPDGEVVKRARRAKGA